MADGPGGDDMFPFDTFGAALLFAHLIAAGFQVDGFAGVGAAAIEVGFVPGINAGKYLFGFTEIAVSDRVAARDEIGLGVGCQGGKGEQDGNYKCSMFHGARLYLSAPGSLTLAVLLVNYSFAQRVGPSLVNSSRLDGERTCLRSNSRLTLLNTLQIATACLFDDNNRLLLVRKRDTRMFMLPGGKREPGESPLAALQRELREELQLSLPEQALTSLGHFKAKAANELDTWVAADVFVARLPHAVQAMAELEELAWLAPGAPLPANLAPLLREQILPALEQAGISS